MMRRAALALVLSCAAAPVTAQGIAPVKPSCFDSIPASALTRVVTFTHATLPAPLDPREQPMRTSVILFAEAVAERVRQLLHAAKDALPAGEPTLSWRAMEPAVAVMAYRDGHFRGEVSRAAPRSAWSTSAAGAELLVRAMDSLRADGESFVWDGDVPGDSVSFTLELTPSIVGPNGTVTLPTMMAGTPTMTLYVPTAQPVQPRHQQRPFYPPDLRATGYSGSLVMEFLVDTDGRVVEQSLHDVWLAGRPRPTAADGVAYHTFMEAVRRALLGSTFEPARLGGCPVHELVRQPFEFSLRR